jgi:hypothetical protein
MLEEAKSIYSRNNILITIFSRLVSLLDQRMLYTGTILRTFRYYAQRERVKCILHGSLSVLLLFTAAIVSNIESVQQTLNLTLDPAYEHVFLPVEVLIWVRSLVIVLLIVAHAMRHVQGEPAPPTPAQVGTQLVLTPELIDALRAALAQVDGLRGTTAGTASVTRTSERTDDEYQSVRRRPGSERRPASS